MNVNWSNSLWKVGFLGLSGIQILKVTYMSCLGKVCERLTNKIQIFEDLKISIISFSAIEPIRKAGNDGKLLIFSVFFETVDYVFCLKELLWIYFLLLSDVFSVSGVSVESTWAILLLIETLSCWMNTVFYCYYRLCCNHLLAVIFLILSLFALLLSFNYYYLLITIIIYSLIYFF